MRMAVSASLGEDRVPVDYGGREVAASRSPYPAPFCWHDQITGNSPPKPWASH